MKITDNRIEKMNRFGYVKVGDIFQSNVTQNIFIKTNYNYGDTNAFCLNENEEFRFCADDKITLLDVELIINN